MVPASVASVGSVTGAVTVSWTSFVVTEPLALVKTARNFVSDWATVTDATVSVALVAPETFDQLVPSVEDCH